MTDVDAMLAQARARQAAVAARNRAILARLESREQNTSGSGDRDGAMMRQLTKIWKRKGFRPCRGTSSITLPSGGKLVYDWKAERIVQSS